MNLRARTRPFAWLAIVALLALTLAPTVSRLLASRLAPAQLAVLCSSPGLRGVVALPDARQFVAEGAARMPEAMPAAMAGHLEACALCGPAFAGLAPLPEAASWYGAPCAPQTYRLAASPPAPPAAAWTRAPARAPPRRA